MTIFLVIVRLEYIEEKYLRKKVIDETLYLLRTIIPRYFAEKYKFLVLHPLLPLRAREFKLRFTTTIIVPYYYAWRRDKVEEVFESLKEELERRKMLEWKEINVFISP